MPPRKKKAAPSSAGAARAAAPADPARSYDHPDATVVSRPEAGAQDSFKAKKPPKTWRYDSSLAPELQWDPNGARVRERAFAPVTSHSDSCDEIRMSS